MTQEENETTPSRSQETTRAAGEEMENDSADGSNSSRRSPTVTIDSDISDEHDNVDAQASVRRRRGPFISRHRQNLDRIQTDSVLARRHEVPDTNRRSSSRKQSNNNSTSSSSQFGGRGGGDCSDDYENDNWNCCGSHKTASQWLETVLPMWSWLQTYQWKSTLPHDLVAGLTVAVMIIPQSMSYAKLAGLPVEYGLYSSLVPVYAYSLFGSSRQLAVGPVALISLLLSTGLSFVLKNEGFEPDTAEYQERYNRLAVQTSFLVGTCYIVMGLLRLGFVTIFLSHAVISGFTSGAAVIIGMSQVKYLFGYAVERSDRLHELLHNIFSEIQHFNWKTFVLGSLSIAALVAAKNIGRTVPKLKFLKALGPLLVTTVTIGLVVIFDLQDKGIPVVGSIPKGFPKLTVSEWTPIEDLSKLTVLIASIVIVGFMESIAIAKQLASKHKYEIDASQELIGLGMSNFLGGMFNAYPVTGSFSRSAVNNESGAQSGISAMVTATGVGIVLLFLTAVFEKLPLCVLAAIVIAGVFGLVDYEEAIYLYQVHRFDFAVWIVACLGTMFLGVEIGLAIAVGVSLLIVLYESAYPHTSVLGRLPGSTVYRNVKQYPNAERYDGIVLMRIDAPLYFANAQNVRDKIRKYRLQAERELETRSKTDAEQGHPHAVTTVKYLILELGPVSRVDTSALHILSDMVENYRSRGQQLCFSNPSLPVMERLVSSGLAEKVGREHIFTSINDAVRYCLNEMDCEATSMHESMHGTKKAIGGTPVESDMDDGEDLEHKDAVLASTSVLSGDIAEVTKQESAV